MPGQANGCGTRSLEVGGAVVADAEERVFGDEEVAGFGRGVGRWWGCHCPVLLTKSLQNQGRTSMNLKNRDVSDRLTPKFQNSYGTKASARALVVLRDCSCGFRERRAVVDDG